MLPCASVGFSLQGCGLLLQQSAAALSVCQPWAFHRTASRSRGSASSTQSSASGAGRQQVGAAPRQRRQPASLLLLSPLSPWSTAARLHHLAVELASSDEEPSPTTASSSQPATRSGGPPATWLDQQRLSKQQQHLHQQQQQLHHLASHPPQQSVTQQQQQQQQPRYQGHLHAPHGRRHSTSHSQVDRFISEQLLSCKSLGMLRRIMIKHKATMEPEHVADTVLCLQHLVRATRHARRAGVRPGLAFMHHATSQARSQPRVRASGEFSRSKVRSSESDGHMEQLMAQMLGELGSMIWFMMGDMTGPDLAKVLYSWAMLEWHPEPELLADVKASFIAAAAGGGLQQQTDPQHPPQQQQQQPGQQQWVELEAWQGPWMAAGLWGLLKLAEPCEGRVLQLLQQHWRQLVRYWTPQQLADIAGALALTADEQVAAAVTAGGDEAGQLGQEVQAELQLTEVVMGLSQHLLAVLGQQQQGGEEGAEPLVPLPWPESMLIQLQTALLSASVPAAQCAAAAVNEIAASVAGGGAAEAAGGGVPMMAVGNVPQLAWRMLQSLAAVGVNVSEPEDQVVGAVVAALSEATKVPSSSRML